MGEEGLVIVYILREQLGLMKRSKGGGWKEKESRRPPEKVLELQRVRNAGSYLI